MLTPPRGSARLPLSVRRMSKILPSSLTDRRMRSALRKSAMLITGKSGPMAEVSVAVAWTATAFRPAMTAGWQDSPVDPGAGRARRA